MLWPHKYSISLSSGGKIHIKNNYKIYKSTSKVQVPHSTFLFLQDSAPVQKAMSINTFCVNYQKKKQLLK